MESKMVSVMNLDKYQVDSVLLCEIITHITILKETGMCIVSNSTQIPSVRPDLAGFCVAYFGFVLRVPCCLVTRAIIALTQNILLSQELQTLRIWVATLDIY